MTDLEPVVDVLALLAEGDRPGAERAARQTSRNGAGLLAPALASYLAGADGAAVYDRPAAFEAFIRHGGNIGLYQAVSAALAQQYQRYRPARLLDIGCGDASAILPALRRSSFRPARVELLEPSASLLQSAVDGFDASGLDLDLNPVNATLEDFLGALAPPERWGLVESTFALSALPTALRGRLLARLQSHVGRIVIAEFDVPDLPPGSRDQLRSLAERYERGLAEYGDQRDLVAQGFLMPVLTGQLAPGAVRATWEQPAGEWLDQLAAAGFTEVRTEPLHDYWSAPAFLLTARGGAEPVGG